MRNEEGRHSLIAATADSSKPPSARSAGWSIQIPFPSRPPALYNIHRTDWLCSRSMAMMRHGTQPSRVVAPHRTAIIRHPPHRISVPARIEVNQTDRHAKTADIKTRASNVVNRPGSEWMHICRRRVAGVPTGRSHAATRPTKRPVSPPPARHLLGCTLGAAGDPPCWTST